MNNEYETLTPEEALTRLKKLNVGEYDHIEADAILCGLLLFYDQTEVVEAFDQIDKWYA